MSNHGKARRTTNPGPLQSALLRSLHLLATFTLFASATFTDAQTTYKKIDFALPFHAGALAVDQGSFQITRIAAKSDGDLYEVQADDHGLLFSGKFFVWPSHHDLTAPACRDAVLESEGQKSLDAAMNRIDLQSSSGVNVALVLMIPKDSSSSAVRAFVASGDLCADLTFSSLQPVKVHLVPLQKVKDILLTLTFNPTAAPNFRGAFSYATVEFNDHQYAGAAAAYRAALQLVDTEPDALRLRRITTDQLSIALGMSGDLNQARAVNQAAIARDPTYPLYYYNLACADAEQGDADAAHLHLQQAFARSANTLPGERLPNPATDQSFLKLKSNATFWAFLQTLTPGTKP